MSKLKTGNLTIFEALNNIEQGKYVMPAFQRQYVWNMEQIEKLWDSILLDYPIATFLFWHIDEDNVTWDTYFCRFLTSTTFTNNKLSDNINFQLSSINLNISDTAILDGQQRLTSFYLSLCGTIYIREKHARKKTHGGTIAELIIELNKNNFSSEEIEYNNKHFNIKFTDKIGKLTKSQFKIRRLINEKYRNKQTRQQAIDEVLENINPQSKEYANTILNKLCEKIYDEKLICYTEVNEMKQDDALEMFVRFNSGGKALKPPEITMSILEAYWPSARLEIGRLLTESFVDFGTDFIIRTALMLYGNVEKTIINKQIADDLKNNWTYFKKALKNLEEFLSDINISISRFSGKWNVLLPIIYVIYKNHNYKGLYKALKVYLVRSVLFGFFNSGTKQHLQKIKTKIIQNDNEITIDMLDNMYELRVIDSRIGDILNSEKGLLTNYALYFLGSKWIKNGIKYEQDHLHPESQFSDDNLKPLGISFEEWKEWKANRNRLPNLHLLEGRNNASKSDMRLVDYINDMNIEQKKYFYKQTFIKPGIDLEFDNFGRFYEARKKVLEEKLRKILTGEE